MKEHWKRIGKVPHHGICVHLASIRTQKSSGIGTFLDLIPLIDWCKDHRLDLLQILPINDSGPDASPYNAQSSIALDPIYICFEELGITGHDFSELNASSHVLRRDVLRTKTKALKNFFDKTFEKSPEYLAFVEENESWLKPYITFKAMKEMTQGDHWKLWPKKLPPISEKVLDFYAFLQFLSFSQMKAVHFHAKKQGVLLMGDIPILLNPDSVDVWSHKHLFNLDLSAGAPPDFYNPDGQDWGFPLIDREEMKKEDFLWWKRRLKIAENFFDIYRIDHVIGLFRIWATVDGMKPIEGSYFPKKKNLWAKNGREMLEMMIESTHLFPIAEDLGTLSPGIKNTLKSMKITGTSLILQMRTRNGKGKFIPFSKYRPESLSTISTHDSPTFDLWWKMYPEEAALFASFMKMKYEPFLNPSKKLKILRAAHRTPSYFHVNLLQEYLSIFPELSWLNREDERINVPGKILPTNWTYRYRPTLEEILLHKGLSEAMHTVIPQSSQ